MAWDGSVKSDWAPGNVDTSSDRNKIGDNLKYLKGEAGTVVLGDGLDLGTNELTINSVEIVGSDGEVNKAAVEDSGNWDAAYTHSLDNSQAHSDYLRNNGNDSTTGRITCAGVTSTDDINMSNSKAINANSAVGNYISLKAYDTNSGLVEVARLGGETNSNVAGLLLQRLNFSAVQASKTLSSGVLDITDETYTCFVCAAETGVTDDLVTITGGAMGDVICVLADAGDTITVKDSTGNVSLPADRALDHLTDRLWLWKCAVGGWVELLYQDLG